MKRIFLALALSVASALAADISGTWKGTAETPNGNVERTFVFKQDGEKLTGETTSQMMGKSTITDGKVAGESVTFSINVKFGDNDMMLNYKGKISGDEIRFHVEGPGGGPSIEYVAKKIS